MKTWQDQWEAIPTELQAPDNHEEMFPGFRFLKVQIQNYLDISDCNHKTTKNDDVKINKAFWGNRIMKDFSIFYKIFLFFFLTWKNSVNFVQNI